ncbi:MAG TPA: hypothetical protein ENN46_04710 [Candidatus Woesearchaeota archaeon]|nr:hypothetical protein [Candidatus Woesearchaeota archaeon]
MPQLKKKALMGIGTLIIFIAIILVAAVAAAVLISTSNVLQQRALLTGREVRESITNAANVLSIMAASNSTTETFNNFEILIQLQAGSDPIALKRMFVQMITPRDEFAATFIDRDEIVVEELGALAVGAGSSIMDLDEDGISETILLLTNATTGNEYLIVNFSTGFQSEPIILPNLSDAGTVPVNIIIAETAIRYGEDVYGVVELRGQTNTDDQIDESVTFKVKNYPEACSFELLQPEEKFCVVKIIDINNDYTLNSGERFRILIKTREENVLRTTEHLQLILSTERGLVFQHALRTPDVIDKVKTALWPIG